MEEWLQDWKVMECKVVKNRWEWEQRMVSPAAVAGSQQWLH
jgi:hypothetical protein